MPRIIAHRGASHAAPENTLAAFELAWVEGADGIEGDFRLTRDGEIVCIHDPDTRRTSTRDQVVARSDWSELGAIDVGSWKSPRFADQRIPRIADIVARVPPGKDLFIEIKSGSEIVRPLAELLIHHHADPGRVTLISFDEGVIAACRRILPAFQAHWISRLEQLAAKEGEDTYRRILHDCGATGLQFESGAMVRREWIERLHDEGLLTAAWVVDDLPTARRLIDAGVDFLTSNRPAGLRAGLGG